MEVRSIWLRKYVKDFHLSFYTCLSFSCKGFKVKIFFNFLLTITWNSLICYVFAFVLQLLIYHFQRIIYKVNASVIFCMNSKDNFADVKA